MWSAGLNQYISIFSLKFVNFIFIFMTFIFIFQSNSELVAKGYPDIGWDPVEGERYLDFLRFCVWINGESVEENANLVIRLLIRRPECLGVALKGEGQGLFSAFKVKVFSHYTTL